MTKHIIIIDNFDSGGRVLVNAVTALNYHPYHADNIHDAKQYMDKHQACLIIVAMTVRYKSAFDLMPKLKPALNVPVIGISADITIEKRKKAREAGMEDIIPRSIAMEELQNIIEQYVSQ